MELRALEAEKRERGVRTAEIEMQEVKRKQESIQIGPTAEYDTSKG